MSHEHKEYKEVDKIFKSAPNFSFPNHESSLRILQKLEELDAELGRKKNLFRFKRIITNAWLNVSILSFLIIMLVLSFNDTLINTQQNTAVPPTEEGIVEPAFIELSKMYEEFGLRFVGEEGKFGLLTTQSKPENVQEVFLFQEDIRFSSTWIVNTDYAQKNNVIFKVVANHDNVKEYVFLSEAIDIEKSLNINDSILIDSVCNEGCVFPEGGNWKLTLFIDDNKIGNILINVEPIFEESVKLKEQLLQKKEEIVSDFIHTHRISLEGFSYIEEILFTDYHKSLSNIMGNIRVKQKLGSFLPHLYVSSDKKHAFILEKEKDGTNILYNVSFQNGEWEIVETDEKPGKIVEEL